MEKREKKRSLIQKISDYTVIDLETTGMNSQTCEIIEMAAVRVRNCEIVAKFSSLVRPEHRISSNVEQFTGISNAMVQNAPSCAEILKEYLDFIGDDIIIGHNIQTFDCKVLSRVAEELLHKPFSNDLIDTVYFSRYCDISPDNYKLTTLSTYLSIPHPDAHRALGDCIANQKCYEALKPLLTEQYHETSGTGSKNRHRVSESTRALHELSEYIKYMIADDYISDIEISVLEEWLEDNKNLAGNYPYDVIYEKLADILEDRIITDSEREELLDLLIDQSDPVQFHSEECKSIDFTNKVVCLTGDFDSGSRSEMERTFQSAGAVISKNVTLKTDYLIVGGSGSAAWSCGNYGNKVKKALELQKNGKPIVIIREDTAMQALHNPHIDEAQEAQNDDEKASPEYKMLIDIINRIIKEAENKYLLPSDFLTQIQNQDSNSLWIVEPMTKKQSQMILAFRTRGKKNAKYIRITLKRNAAYLSSHPSSAQLLFDENNNSVCYLDVHTVQDNELISFLRKVIFEKVEGFEPTEKFGCCDLYRECSAAKKCIHRDLFYARACWYRKNLESGKIFY